MTQEMKIKMFEEVLQLTHLSEIRTYDNRDYFEQSEGAYKMLQILGLDKEYRSWSYGK